MKSAQEIASSSYSPSSRSSSSASASASTQSRSTSGTTWNQPKKAARKRPHTPLASTEPVIHVRDLPVDDDDEVHEKPVKKTAPAEGNSAKANARKNPAAAVTPPAQPATLTAKARIALEKQWFDAVRHPGLKGRMDKLIDMLAKYPDLPNRKDPDGRPAIFHTITNGDKILTPWLLERMTMPDLKEAIAILTAVFAEPVFAGDTVIEVMDQFLSKLDRSVATHAARYFLYKRSNVPPAYRNALTSHVHPDIPPISQVDQVSAAKPTSSQLQPQRVASEASNTVALSLRDDRSPASSANAARSPEQKEKFIREFIRSAKQNYSQNPMLTKIVDNDLDGVETLLKNPGAKRMLRTATRDYDMNPLALASALDRPSIIEKILQSPEGQASALVINRYGFTPLHLAVDMGLTEAAKALLRAPNAIDQIKISRPILPNATTVPSDLNLTPVYMAVYTGNADILRSILAVPDAANLALLPGPNNLTPLQLAVISNNATCAAELVKLTNAELQLRVQDEAGRNVLAQALQQKSLAVGKLLLERPEAETLIREHFHEGMNVLTSAISSRDEKTVELLLASPYAEWLAADDAYNGNNALMCCTRNPSATTLRIAERL